MKNKVRNKLHYTLLLMRDDSQVRSFQIKSSRLRLLCVFILVFILAGVAGWFVSVRYMQRFYSLQAEFQTQRIELTKAKLDLEQLRNVKTLAQNSTSQISPAANTELGMELQQNTLNTEEGPGQDSPADAALQNALTLSRSNSTQEEHIKISSTESPFTIEAFSTKKVSGRRVYISYDLSNVDGKQISGSVVYHLFFKDGSQSEVTPQNPKDTTFSISRLKKMDVTLQPPSGMKITDCQSLQITITTDEGKLYRESFPLKL